MDKPQSALHFKLMSLGFKFRDFFFSRKKILEEPVIKPGFHVLDYGCGPGSYIISAAKMVGKSGKIYALDISPLAIQKVERTISGKRLENVITISSSCETGLPDNSIDVVLFYDVLHELSEPDKALKELHRVLKSKGTLSSSDHHMDENEILSKITNKGLFTLFLKGKKTYNFTKVE